jgi:hypothetical protein
MHCVRHTSRAPSGTCERVPSSPALLQYLCEKPFGLAATTGYVSRALVTSKKFQHNMKGSDVACIWVEAFAVILTGLSVYSDVSVGSHDATLPGLFFDFDIDVLELSLG